MKKAFPEVKKQVLDRFKDPHSRHIFDIASKIQTPQREAIFVNQGDNPKDIEVTRIGMGPLETPYGGVWLFSFELNDKWLKYSVLVKCSEVDYETLKPVFSNKQELLVRIDSGCETGQVFLDNTCECREQLHETMRGVIDKGEGVIVNIPGQDGRGKGLPFKLATLFLQQQLGLDTVESAACLADQDDIDVRTYSGVIAIIKFLGISPEETTINLATNNPDKLKVFKENGYSVTNTPVEIEPTEHTARHLNAKKDHLCHTLGRSTPRRPEWKPK